MNGSKGHATRGFVAVPLKDLAARFGLTVQGVRKIEQGALAKLRRHPVMRALALEIGLAVPCESS